MNSTQLHYSAVGLFYFAMPGNIMGICTSITVRGTVKDAAGVNL
jgi:hypothetical protein